tara:strand:- start:34 stop:423 length:390 start_codon:yes stop_codon:yes gene_type:complete
MNNKAQLLLVSGLLMSITLIAVTASISHSVNIGKHQGERHDLTPVISSIEQSFPLALEYEVDNAGNEITLSVSFDNVADDFETVLISRGYSSAFTLVAADEDGGTHTFAYSYTITDGTMSVEINKSITF